MKRQWIISRNFRQLLVFIANKSQELLIISVFPIIFFAWTVAQAEPSWSSWVQQLRVEAVQDGVQPAIFDQIFNTLSTPSSQVLHFYNTQPERRLTFLAYRSSRANQPRINMGKQELRKQSALLSKIERDFGVDPQFVLALWGLETDYGHFMGSFPVIPALATLAYNSRRPQFFRNELLRALHIVQEGHVSLANFKGEWAGASGYPQFLPSSWYRYAVDYDGDGRKNIWTSLPDGLASIANYLAKNGWRAGEPWAMEVNLPANFDKNALGKNIVKSVAEWRRLGVQTAAKPWPNNQLAASIIQVGDEDGVLLMIFNNFRTLQTWNDSNYYVSTVGYLADKLTG